MGLLARHASRSVKEWGQRFLLLVDSAATIGCVTKGISSVFSLLLQMRRLLAIVMVTGLRLILRWTPSHWNFADWPSRGGPCGVAPDTKKKAEILSEEQADLV